MDAVSETAANVPAETSGGAEPVAEVGGREWVLKRLSLEVHVPVRWSGLVRVPSDIDSAELEKLSEQVRDQLEADAFSPVDSEDVLGLVAHPQWSDATVAEDGEQVWEVNLTESGTRPSESVPEVGPRNP